MDKSKLKNNYYLMRHGNSLANDKGIVLSDPAVGTKGFGLSEKGKSQVRKTASALKGITDITIYSSDFLRTVETAQILKTNLSTGGITLTPKLRERFFGNYEGRSNENYRKIWEKDYSDDDNNAEDVESPAAVAKRTKSLIEEIEQRYDGKTIILVSHGDCLQILQTVFENIAPSKHRSLPHLDVAELRKI